MNRDLVLREHRQTEWDEKMNKNPSTTRTQTNTMKTQTNTMKTQTNGVG